MLPAMPVLLRAATLDDVPAIGLLARARERAFSGAEETSDEEIRHDLAAPDVDLGADTWLATDQVGAVLGYADVLPAGEAAVNATLWTPPEASEPVRLAEEALLDAVERRAGELARAAGAACWAVHVFALPAELDRIALLERRGYEMARTFLRMALDAGASWPPAPVPPEVVLSPLAPERDAAEVHALLLRAFTDDDVYGVPADLAAWRHETVDDARWVPGPSHVARWGEEVVGAVVGFPDGDQGWVRHLGVAASQRGRGLGAALLAAAFDAFRAMGLPRVGLGVDAANRTGAARLYERMGMRAERRVDMRTRRVPAA
jgi:mycothiol synthase